MVYQTMPMSGRSLAEVNGRIIRCSQDEVGHSAFGFAERSRTLTNQDVVSVIQHGPEQSVGIPFDLSDVLAGAALIDHSIPTSLRALVYTLFIKV